MQLVLMRNLPSLQTLLVPGGGGTWEGMRRRGVGVEEHGRARGRVADGPVYT